MSDATIPGWSSQDAKAKRQPLEHARLHSAGRWMRRGLLGVGIALLLVAGYLGGGFLRFAQEITMFAAPAKIERADGIVVLTGGAARLDQAIDLLKTGLADRLLISGVNPGTSIDTLSRLTATDRSWFDCCVDIDYAANTVGNAEMTNRWARLRGFDELILVTSDYHMPRSLREFDRVSEVRTIIPYAVRRADLWSSSSLPNGMGLKVLVTEYAKLLAVRFRDVTGIEARNLVGGRRVAALGQQATGTED
ncbi:YdcF family protein [Mangrovicella endophytica]|uniref:YdcF family protein n=1 Tax=Mangrovicella endophytica TaxID=2066697 RepID=UPI000C9DEF75|nr:YdcF family protein [Mangrovicella endophytica]